MRPFAPRFASRVSARILTFWSVGIFCALYVAKLVFDEWILVVVRWSAATMGMTPTAALEFALTNPLASFFGLIGILLVAIFALAWLDVRRLATAKGATQTNPTTAETKPSNTQLRAESTSTPPPTNSYEAFGNAAREWGRALNEPRPNIVAVLSAWRYVRKTNDWGALAPSDLGEPSRFRADCASFRNNSVTGRTVARAPNVRARVVVGNDTYHVTGHWLGSAADNVNMDVDAGAYDLVVAITDEKGTYWLVDDRREVGRSGGCVEYPVFHTKGITLPDYSFKIILSSKGAVVGEFRYVLKIRPFGGLTYVSD